MPKSNHVGPPQELLGGHAHQQLCGRREPDGSLAAALALRYQVYCLEQQFLSASDYPDGLERDEHDATAAHFYAFNASRELIGYVRLVRPDSKQRFPFQDHCRTSVSRCTLPAPSHAVEISRLMLREDYRRPRGGSPEIGVNTDSRRLCVPDNRFQVASGVLLDLYRQMYVYSRANGIDYWYAAMERPLARLIHRLNPVFMKIGPHGDYYGPVAPYLASLEQLDDPLVSAFEPEYGQKARYDNSSSSSVPLQLFSAFHAPVSQPRESNSNRILG